MDASLVAAWIAGVAGAVGSAVGALAALGGTHLTLLDERRRAEEATQQRWREVLWLEHRKAVADFARVGHELASSVKLLLAEIAEDEIAADETAEESRVADARVDSLLRDIFERSALLSYNVALMPPDLADAAHEVLILAGECFTESTAITKGGVETPRVDRFVERLGAFTAVAQLWVHQHVPSLPRANALLGGRSNSTNTPTSSDGNDESSPLRRGA